MRDPFGLRREAPRRVHVQVFDQLAVDDDDTLALRLRRRVGLDNAPRPLEVILGGRKHPVGGGQRFGVDQGFAVEAEVAALAAGGLEAGSVGEVEVNPVEHRQAMRAGGENAQRQRGQQRRAVGRVRGAEIDITTGSPPVTSTSSSMRTPMFHHFGSISGEGLM